MIRLKTLASMGSSRGETLIPPLGATLLAGLVCLHGGPANSSLAGPLNPPAGAVTPTPGPEPRIAINAVNTPGDADSLFKITQPGSYYLTDNVTGVAAKHGIEIFTSNVTIDLMGFRLLGQTDSLAGIVTSSANIRRIVVRNGIIAFWGGNGIDLSAGGLGGSMHRVEQVMVSGSETGIVGGIDSIIDGCQSVDCTIGIDVNQRSIVRNCVASDCALGIRVGASSLVSQSVTNDNEADGIVAEFGSEIIDCVSNNNIRDGIVASSQCLIRGNTCRGLGLPIIDGAGVHVTGSGNRIDSNTVSGYKTGIDVDSSGNLIIRNSAEGIPTGYSISSSNVAGPIVTSSNVATNNNPHANYSP